MVLPDVAEALRRAGMPVAGSVRLFHATDATAAASVRASQRLLGGLNGQAWLASRPEIAELQNGAGASFTADAPARDIETVVEIEVDADQLYFEETRSS